MRSWKVCACAHGLKIGPQSRRGAQCAPIAYSCLTDDEYKYTIGLFAGKATFQFTHPKAGSSTETETTTCYCSKYGIAWHNAKTKQWKNLKFNIIEC